LATGNAGKVRELQVYFAGRDLEFKSQKELGVSSVAETGTTFIENAIIKARHAAEVTGLPALADDSGLMVKALDDAPGIYSARYAGVDATDEQRMEMLLQELGATGSSDRTACFCCALAYFRHAKDPAPVLAFGQWWGEIMTSPVGDDGFGYDPIFWVPTHQCSAAQLDAQEKNCISHRGIAMQVLMQQF
jgi:XTP/dITP diphosphohydrolase